MTVIIMADHRTARSNLADQTSLTAPGFTKETSSEQFSVQL
jgi:hypothetical protein